MLKNYFKIALRNLSRSKVYTLINILGLALAITSVVLIFILVKYHLSFDTFHSNAERVYRVTTELRLEDVSHYPGVPSPLGEVLRNDYTFAEKVARVYSSSNELITITSSVANQKFEENIAFAESTFFDILDFPLVKGNIETMLNEPNTAIITNRIAKKYFGEQDPIGQTMRIDNQLDVIITGVLKDLPENTDRRQEIYLPFDNLKNLKPWLVEENWWFSINRDLQCFILLKQNVSSTIGNEVLAGIPEKYYGQKHAKEWHFQLQHLSDIHFNPDLGGYVAKKNLWTLSLVALFIIITACMNFINLSTARSLARSKEIGVRKALGSNRWQLFWQFIAETAVVASLAMILAFIITQLTLPFVNQIFNTKIQIYIYRDVYLLIFMALLLIVVIFLSGSYPGFILAGFKPVLALKGKLTQRHTGSFVLRKGLVVTQFAISQLLIISTIIIASQMRYSRQADMGFQKNAIVMVPVPSNETSKISTLRSKLSQISGVENATFCNYAPASETTPTTGIRFASRTESEPFTISFKAGDHYYVPTFGLEIVAGRNLYPSDTVREFLINETTVINLQVSMQDVIGQRANINGKDGTIVGVIRDFHNKSFHETIDPVYISTQRDNYENIAVKITTSSLRSSLAGIEGVWNEVYPYHVYKFNFLDEQIAKLYEQDYVFFRLIQVGTGIAIVIGCLGLYGLVSFIAFRKIKEIGVRKILGASEQSIVWLFGKEFLGPSFIAFAIAAPTAWLVMNNWLNNFEYRIQIGLGVFLLTILITLTVVVLAVGYRSVKAALMDPIESLRAE